MSRRDTIIIAVLVNAGLLMVLFATAMSSKEEKPENPSVQLVENYAQPSKPAAPASQEEMDQMLNQYVAAVPTLSEIPSEEIVVSTPSVISSMPAETAEIKMPIASTSTMQIPSQNSNTIATTSASSTDTGFVAITVKKGDYLDKIAKNNGSTVNDIMKANHLENTQLKIGQVLKVPVKSASQTTKDLDSKATEIARNDPEYYVVKNGDNPWLIASKNQVKLEDLLKLNNLDDQKAKKLKPGDKLRIR